MGTEGLHYREYGSGSAVVLVHGFPDDGTIWTGMAEALAARHRVIVPDMPGAGKTRLEGSVSIAEMATGIKMLLDKLGIEKAVVAGHSMGGYIALAFAKQYPASVAGLTLVHSTPKADDDEKKKTRQKAIDLILSGGKEAFIKQMTGNLFAPTFRDANPELMREKAAASCKISAEALANFYRAMMGRENTVDVVQTAPYPVQWVLGSEDYVISFKAAFGLCYASAVNFVHLYTGCGHMSMLERPDALIADLEQFAGYCYRNP